MKNIEKLSGIHDLKEIQDYWTITHEHLMKSSLEDRCNQYLGLYTSFISKFNNRIPGVVKLLEDIAKSLIGAKLITPNNQIFTIAMIEIYADGIWDESGDYIKEIFQFSKTTAIKKMRQGPMLYYHFGRLDIKVFGPNLPFSFLIRNLITPDGTKLSNNENGAAYPDEGYETIFGVPKGFFSETTPSEEFQLDGNHGFKLEMPSTSHQINATKRILNGYPTGLSGLYKHCNWNLAISPKNNA